MGPYVHPTDTDTSDLSVYNFHEKVREDSENIRHDREVAPVSFEKAAEESYRVTNDEAAYKESSEIGGSDNFSGGGIALGNMDGTGKITEE